LAVLTVDPKTVVLAKKVDAPNHRSKASD